MAARNPDRKETEETVDVELSNAELLEKGKAHAAALNGLDDLREKIKEKKKALKLELDLAEQNERALRLVIETGKEPRPLACYEEPDFKKGIVTIRRSDNGKVVRTRKMTDEERQMDLDRRARGAMAVHGEVDGDKKETDEDK